MKSKKSSLERDHLVGRVPPQPSPVLVQQQAMRLAVPDDAIDLWKLEPPSIEYHADTCDVRDVVGCPTLFFAQVDPFDPQRVLNAIVISFPRRHFDLLWGTLGALRSNLKNRVEQRYRGVLLPGINEQNSLSQASMRRFHCATARIALNADVTMADFYSIAPYVKEQGDLTRDLKLGLVRPCIRIYMTPVVFQRLSEQGDKFEGRGK
jgi:hypothetical protein